MLDLHPNLALSGLISELLVYCTNKAYGCPQIVRQDALHGHVLYCSYAPSVCPNKNLGCPYKGTMRDAKEHLHNCVYERFKGYIDFTNKRFEKLESLLAVRGSFGKGVVYTTEADGSDSTSKSNNEPDGSQRGDSSPSSGTRRTVVSTFPHDEITCHRTIAIHPCGVTSVAVNQDRVFAGAHDGSTKVFDINTGELLKDSKGHTMSVWGLAVVPSGDRYFSAGSDGTIKVWDWLKEDEESCLVKSIPDHNAKVYGLVVDQGRLYSASSDKTVKVWDIETLECLATFQGHTGGVNSLAALPDASSRQLVTGSSDKTIKLWDVTTGTCLKTVRRGTSEVLDVAVGDGMIFGSTYDAVIHVYDLNETRELGTLSGHNWEVWQLEYGQGHLFSASFDHTIKRWDPRRFQCDLTLKGHKSFVHGMALADNYLVTGCADRTIKVGSAE
ncbi:WD40-repeat-containing domain protein [Gamsiella multidivaricata]|uniref:WD40-repeat-containing domain protein n=1 Tax=Gamsiella multidivaricata TaxID=101098 RepID=UPI0022209BB2|nr:WD40-repeat-containing domain protein [Gamsiella multidivaricata]KAI7829546.1 WD40-repeat-containing domain protein [Gamsiella multidivaricata]